MEDKNLTYTCRLELSKNDPKTSTQIGLAYSPERTILYEKAPLGKLPEVRMGKNYKPGTIFTPHDTLTTTYAEAYTSPAPGNNVNYSTANALKQPREYSRLGQFVRPLNNGITEYKDEFLPKQIGNSVSSGVSVEKITTCPMITTGRDEREPLPLNNNYSKYLDIYISTTRMAHRAFTLDEQKTIAMKDIVTLQETMNIPKGRGFGCKFPMFPGQDLDRTEKHMTDEVVFRKEAKLRFMPKKMPKVPNFGSESETQAAYTKPEGVAIPHLFERYIEYPEAVVAPAAKQTLCPPGMYSTETSNINHKTSPQAVV